MLMQLFAVPTQLSNYIGTVPQWGMLAAFGFAIWKLALGDGQKIREELLTRVEQLKQDHDNCTESLNDLYRELDGMRRQRIQEQISMMRAILKTVEDPNLRKQLEMLEALQIDQQPINYVGGPIQDTHHD